MRAKKILILLILVFLGLISPAISQCNYSEPMEFNSCQDSTQLPFVLIFEDNFDSLCLDETKWEIYIGTTNSYNMQKQEFHQHKEWSQRENIELEGGYLRMITRKEIKNDMEFIGNWTPYTILKSDFEYTSAAIASKEQFPINGKFEARIKLPGDYGLWPAFWLYGEYEGDYNEIDVFEAYTSTRSFNSNYYYASHGGYSKAYNCMRRNIKTINKKLNLSFDSLTTGFHTYTLIWDEDKIQWLIDGKLIRQVARYIRTSLFGLYRKEYYYPTLQNGEKYRQDQAFPIGDMQIMFNIAVLLPPDSPYANSELNTAMLIDYIKVYRRTNN